MAKSTYFTIQNWFNVNYRAEFYAKNCNIYVKI